MGQIFSQRTISFLLFFFCFVVFLFTVPFGLNIVLPFLCYNNFFRDVKNEWHKKLRISAMGALPALYIILMNFVGLVADGIFGRHAYQARGKEAVEAQLLFSVLYLAAFLIIGYRLCFSDQKLRTLSILLFVLNVLFFLPLLFGANYNSFA